MAVNSDQNSASASTLEQSLKEVVDKTISSSNDVKGLVCCNDQGYLFCSNGSLNEDSAAIIAHLSNLVSQLENDDPVIQLEGNDSRVLIHKRGDIIVGIHKAISDPST